ncbi:hypothetical protein BpHYR1_023854 [Brachionus plicatilis]|uniref:Uncharacterized protein n=1 Tax=Brachionus plicatilis TaxID=10195 RepID=A0A3M7RVQ4_BRAPC|nr:hypothetical protein BpHYR1_023854 [Brachionus plicatilis]
MEKKERKTMAEERLKEQISLKILEESIKDLNQLNFDHLIMIMNFKLPYINYFNCWYIINFITSLMFKFQYLTVENFLNLNYLIKSLCKMLNNAKYMLNIV